MTADDTETRGKHDQHEAYPDRVCPFCGKTVKKYPAHIPECPET